MVYIFTVYIYIYPGSIYLKIADPAAWISKIPGLLGGNQLAFILELENVGRK